MFPYFWRKNPSKIAEKVEPAQSGPGAPRALGSVPDAGPWVVRDWARPGSIALQSKDPRHEVALIVDGVFDSPEQRLAYASDLAAWLNHQIAQAPAPQEPAPEAVQSLSESTASRLDEAPEPALESEVAPLAAPPASREPIESALELDLEPVPDRAPEPSVEAVAPATISQRVTKLIHSTSFPLGRKPATVERPPEPAPARAEKPAQELSGVVCEPLEEVPVPERKSEGPCACHFDLQPGQQPDACVIDLGHPECCTIALSGVAKELCPHWLPIRFVPRAQRAQA